MMWVNDANKSVIWVIVAFPLEKWPFSILRACVCTAAHVVWADMKLSVAISYDQDDRVHDDSLVCNKTIDF